MANLSSLFDPDLLRRYDTPGPRYTSYPTAPQFSPGFDESDLRAMAATSNGDPIPRPLSLYLHIPFCTSPCFYCGCNRIITRDTARGAAYLTRLYREVAMASALFDRDRDVEQVHFGGGTPNFLTPAQIAEVMDVLRRHFSFAAPARLDCSIELDPRFITPDDVGALAAAGFNRASLGVQDFDPEVQRAVNRIQSVEQTLAIIDACRTHGLQSVNVDLIYGLPKQSLAGFSRTLDITLEARPDRLAIYSYAHLPSMFRPQQRINAEDLPSPEVKLGLLQCAIDKLGEAGYVYIGMDHFAKPDDELTVAQRQGRLHRNFQGYSTQAECDLLAFVVSAIGKIGPVYAQNVKTLDEYYDALDRDELPVLRGIELTADDLLRRAIIQALMCHFELSMQSIEIAHLINFREYFAEELADLAEMEKAGLVKIDGDWISVQPGGRLLVRGIAMVFDRYLRADRERQRYSRVI